MYGKARMKMKVALTFACMNFKKLANVRKNGDYKWYKSSGNMVVLNPNIFIVIEKGSEKHDFSERFVYSLKAPSGAFCCLKRNYIENGLRFLYTLKSKWN